MMKLTKGQVVIIVDRFLLYTCFLFTFTSLVELLVLEDFFTVNEIKGKYVTSMIMSAVILLFDRKELLRLQIEKVTAKPAWKFFIRMNREEKRSYYKAIFRGVFYWFTFLTLKYLMPIYPDPEMFYFKDAMVLLVESILLSAIMSSLFKYEGSYKILTEGHDASVTEE